LAGKFEINIGIQCPWRKPIVKVVLTQVTVKLLLQPYLVLYRQVIKSHALNFDAVVIGETTLDWPIVHGKIK